MGNERQAGQVVDGWVLRQRLGKGGNGEVWVAERGGTVAALKLLKSEFLDPTHKRFIRFRDEAQSHARLAPKHPGLLPLLDYSIPDNPGPDRLAWLATPIATSVKAALADKPLPDVVGAVLEVAETLAGLHAESVLHRDIKPENLFQLDGQWLIGDLGLVDFPEKDAITDTGERLGPISYLAPEMLNEAKRADGTMVDVYSLAKTLWVLATQKNIPPGGELRADNPQCGIGAFIIHPQARQLDHLIERSTRHDPAARPTMAEFGNELRDWLRSPQVGPQQDLTTLLARIQRQVAPLHDVEAKRKERESQAQAIVGRLKELLQPLGATFKATTLSAGKVDVDSSAPGRLLGPPAAELPLTTWETGLVINASARVRPPTSPPTGMEWIHLTCVVGVQLRTDLTVKLGAGFLITTMFGTDGHGVTQRIAPLGSATLDHAVTDMITHLGDHLPPALEAFLGWVAREGKPPPAVPKPSLPRSVLKHESN